MTKNSVKNSNESLVTLFCDYFPLTVFFICYKFIKVSQPLIFATVALMIATAIAITLSYIITKKIAKMALFSGLILAVFGSATVIFQNDIFIKMKPTMINSLLALILFYCYYFKKPVLQNLLGAKIEISQSAWMTLTLRWACFFVILALINEVIWRNFATDFWVQFKVFGMLPISLLFTISQVPFMMREVEKFSAR